MVINIVPGYCQSIYMWENVIDFLQKKGHRVYYNEDIKSDLCIVYSSGIRNLKRADKYVIISPAYKLKIGIKLLLLLAFIIEPLTLTLGRLLPINHIEYLSFINAPTKERCDLTLLLDWDEFSISNATYYVTNKDRFVHNIVKDKITILGERHKTIYKEELLYGCQI